MTNEVAPGGATEGERLQKVLARVGFGSRRMCEELIEDERVTVNGEIVSLGKRVDVNTDVVAVDGVRIGIAPDLVYYLLNKPTGYVTTVTDTHGRPTVVELVPDDLRVYPIGRLDMDTSGLLVLTNDGDLTQLVSHPRHGVEKEYLALVECDAEGVGNAVLAKLRRGVNLEDGVTAPAHVTQPQPGVLKITIHEGRNRQIRRMCEALGHPVRELVRTRIGPIRDQNLKPGQWRHLTQQEVIALSTAASQERPDTISR